MDQLRRIQTQFNCSEGRMDWHYPRGTVQMTGRWRESGDFRFCLTHPGSTAKVEVVEDGARHVIYNAGK